jgi:hypothetical protein
MPRYIAEQNLAIFGEQLGLSGLVFDENNTCILGIDDEFSMHITYEPNSDRLYIYSPLLDGLPKDPLVELELSRRLLEGSMLGSQMAGGGVGIAYKEELILFHTVLSMSVGTSEDILKNFATTYVETVEKWRRECKMICGGYDPKNYSEKEVQLLSTYSYLVRTGDLPKPEEALIEACRKRQFGDVYYGLINLTQNLNITDESHSTALHYLMKTINDASVDQKTVSNCITKLLTHGARVDIEDNTNTTVYQYSQKEEVPYALKEQIQRSYIMQQSIFHRTKSDTTHATWRRNLITERDASINKKPTEQSPFKQYFNEFGDCKFELISISEMKMGIFCADAKNRTMTDVIKKLESFTNENLKKGIVNSISINEDGNCLVIEFKKITLKEKFLADMKKILDSKVQEDDKEKVKNIENIGNNSQLTFFNQHNDILFESRKEYIQNELKTFFEQFTNINYFLKENRTFYLIQLDLSKLDSDIIDIVKLDFLQIISALGFTYEIEMDDSIKFFLERNKKMDLRILADVIKGHTTGYQNTKEQEYKMVGEEKPSKAQ